MYIVAVLQWGIAPSEFWAMTICEFLVLFEAKRPDQEGDYAGRLTRGDLDELREWMEAKHEPATA